MAKVRACPDWRHAAVVTGGGGLHIDEAGLAALVKRWGRDLPPPASPLAFEDFGRPAMAYAPGARQAAWLTGEPSRKNDRVSCKTPMVQGWKRVELPGNVIPPLVPVSEETPWRHTNFSADGTRLATLGADRMLKFWRISNGGG